MLIAKVGPPCLIGVWLVQMLTCWSNFGMAYFRQTCCARYVHRCVVVCASSTMSRLSVGPVYVRMASSSQDSFILLASCDGSEQPCWHYYVSACSCISVAAVVFVLFAHCCHRVALHQDSLSPRGHRAGGCCRYSRRRRATHLRLLTSLHGCCHAQQFALGLE